MADNETPEQRAARNARAEEIERTGPDTPSAPHPSGTPSAYDPDMQGEGGHSARALEGGDSDPDAFKTPRLTAEVTGDIDESPPGSTGISGVNHKVSE